MRPHDSYSRSRRPALEALEDRLLLAANLVLPALPGPPPSLPVESFAAAVFRATPLPGAGVKPPPTIQQVDGHAIHWTFVRDGGLTLNDTPPHAADDSVGTDAGVPVRIDVLANDTAPGGDKLAVLYAGKPGHGTLYRDAANPNDFLYQPDAGYVGTDSFTYSAYDRWGDSSDATARILVNGGPQLDSIDRPPVARPVAASTRAGHPVTIDVLAHASDPDSDKLRLDGVVRAALHGKTAIVQGRVVYTPNAGFVGDDSFAYRVSDGHGDTATGQVTVHVAGVAPTPLSRIHHPPRPG